MHLADRATDLIYARIHQLANKQANDVGSGVKISGLGKGGAVLFALPYGVHRRNVVSLVQDLRAETGRAIYLDYASWIDGVGGLPARIEQDIEKGDRSHFLERDTLSLRVLKQGKLHQEMIASEHFADYGRDIDLVVDQTTGKILIAGRPVTSKELPSQKATAIIIGSLLQETSLILKNSDIPASYGLSRYDLHGKIVLPLVKQIKERTGRDLQLTVRGGMYDDYELRLEPSNIVIAVLERKY